MSAYHSEGPMRTILGGDSLAILRSLQSKSVHCCVTSPPYWGLRDYGVTGQLGLEEQPEEYIANMTTVFREVRRVLRDDGTLWLNIGDSYCSTDKWGGGKSGNTGKQTVAGDGDVPSWAVRSKKPAIRGVKPKDLVGIPWMLAFALRADGWYLRQDIIWHKPNPMPESVEDRCTKSHEYVFLMSKSDRYFFNSEAISEPSLRPEGGGNKRHKGKTAYEAGDDKMRTKVGLTEIGARDRRNKRSVWTIPTKPFKEAHFATFPVALVKPCILAGCPPGGVVLDPFMGSGTTLLAANEVQCRAIGIELNPEYIEIAENRLSQGVMDLSGATA